MHKKNPLIFFMCFIVLILLGTILGAKLYKSHNQNEQLFNSIHSIDNYNHHASLSVLTMGDAAIIEHRDYDLNYQYKNNVFHTMTESNEKTRVNSLLNIESIYNMLNIVPSSLYKSLDENYLYLKGQLEKDLTFNFSKTNPTVSFTIEEGYDALVNIMDILNTDDSFNENLYFIYNYYFENASDSVNRSQFFTTIMNLNADFDDYYQISLKPYYKKIIDKFSKDSLITLEFIIKDNVIESLLIKSNLKYNSFQASETIEWLINFDID